MNPYRTHFCSQLNLKNLDKKVTLSGWINSKRDHGNLLFIDLRDNYGVTQCVVDSSQESIMRFRIIYCDVEQQCAH